MLCIYVKQNVVFGPENGNMLMRQTFKLSQHVMNSITEKLGIMSKY